MSGLGLGLGTGLGLSRPPSGGSGPPPAADPSMLTETSDHLLLEDGSLLLLE